MSRQAFISNRAPKPVGPYSHAVKSSGELIFTAGQIGIDPVTGELVEGITEQTRQTLYNLEIILSEAGASLSDVTKATVFLASLEDFSEMNAVYESMVPAPWPVRTTVQAGLPDGILIEIDFVAVA